MTIKNDAAYTEAVAIVAMFSEKEPTEIETINSNKGDTDFREAIIVSFADHGKMVIKLACNDFTFPEKIKMWQKTTETYRQMGCYCPTISPDIHGNFPTICYKGHRCVAYAEEYAPFFSADKASLDEKAVKQYERDVWLLTAKIAAAHFDYTEYPSAYCLFDTFCESDEIDEVLDNAYCWVDYARTLPAETQEQVERIWHLWKTNRMALEPLYRTLPASVFQADLNKTNILLNESGQFAGVYDFNLCGKDVFLNYLLRETFCEDFDKEREMLYERLELVREHYRFQLCEKDAVLLLYRCLKPLWFNKLGCLKSCGNNTAAIKEHLNETERALTEPFDFTAHM